MHFVKLLSGLLEKRIDHVYFIIVFKVNRVTFHQGLFTLSVSELQNSLSVGCLSSSILLFNLDAFFIIAFLVVVKQLNHLLSVLVSGEAAHHLVGVVVDVVYSEAIDLSSSTKSLSSSEPLALELLMVLQEFFHFIE